MGGRGESKRRLRRARRWRSTATDLSRVPRARGRGGDRLGGRRRRCAGVRGGAGRGGVRGLQRGFFVRVDGFGSPPVLALARGRRRARGGARPQGRRDDPRGRVRGSARTRVGSRRRRRLATFRNFPGDFRLPSTRSASTATGPRLRCCSPLAGTRRCLSTLAVYDVDTDGYRTFDFAITGRAPESHAWDAVARPTSSPRKPRLTKTFSPKSKPKTRPKTRLQRRRRLAATRRTRVQSVRARRRARAERRDDEAARERSRRRGVHPLRVSPRVTAPGGASRYPTDSSRSSGWRRPRCSCATKPRRRAAAARASR